MLQIYLSSCDCLESWGDTAPTVCHRVKTFNPQVMPMFSFGVLSRILRIRFCSPGSNARRRGKGLSSRDRDWLIPICVSAIPSLMYLMPTRTQCHRKVSTSSTFVQHGMLGEIDRERERERGHAYMMLTNAFSSSKICIREWCFDFHISSIVFDFIV